MGTAQSNEWQQFVEEKLKWNQNETQKIPTVQYRSRETVNAKKRRLSLILEIKWVVLLLMMMMIREIVQIVCMFQGAKRSIYVN